ncbi:hypothetical protein [Elizabethkingia sp. 2-6]|uniref:hypothetical protein n=1 Tax=Elizabethkingia sp. 2-6 TaxID=2575699 RepID=UPI0010C1F736|nr:hypothetical protein [Elizabethkingia sp. 2-6]QCO45454.1 hypothetical protein FCS00_03385 [Elizabethkingia sp. 2-6]
MKASAVSTITKSLPIGFPTLVNYSLLATLGYINLFFIKELNLENESKPQLPQNGKSFSGDYLMKIGLPWFLNGSLKSSVIELTATN